MLGQKLNQIHAWQNERGRILHRACQSIRAATQRGAGVGRAIRRVASRYNRRQYKCDPSRRIKLSAVTLRRAWDMWQRNGESPDAFRLRYTARPSITAARLVSFVKFCADRRFRSLHAACWAFRMRLGGGKMLRPVSYDVLRMYFTAADFYRLQDAAKTIQTAQIRSAEMLAAMIGAIRGRMPKRAGRRPPAKRGFHP